MYSREQIHEMVRSTLVELFELDAGKVTLDARLNDDLEIDSIDAVDLLDRMRRMTGRRISAEDFRSVRTVGDLIVAIERVVKA
ncbi:MAG TPA: acyl carrier protein [Steroidobacteraceae bacterium]|nr:acyl carrier protein [Steroidobacteraceae bacterium]